MRRLAFVLLLAGCSIGEDPYPASWDPLTPSRAADCRQFDGVYADRGDSPGHSAPASLTRELFGPNSPWEHATRLRFEMPADDVVDVTVFSERTDPVTRRFSMKAGDFACEQGHMVLRSRRWVYSDVMSGRETVKLDLYDAAGYLVARVHEATTGVLFMVVPLSGESARWYRFPRLKP